ncbi:MAG: hypothetical protein HY438_02055 [DPANN group archaeon]|nr:hypothetical protein [DPANN group archaeon]
MENTQTKKARTLEQLTYDGTFFRKSDGRAVRVEAVDLPITFLIQNPESIATYVEKLLAHDSLWIPKAANAYTASKFNPDTQHIRDGAGFSVYAVQFYLKFLSD